MLHKKDSKSIVLNFPVHFFCAVRVTDVSKTMGHRKINHMLDSRLLIVKFNQIQQVSIF